MVYDAHLEVDHFEEKSILFYDTQKLNSNKETPKNFCATKTLTAINRILEKDKNILVYFWVPSTELQNMIERTSYRDLPHFTQKIAKEDFVSLASQVKDVIPQRIFDELGPVFKIFTDLLTTQFFTVELSKTTKRMCPLFHTDRVTLRLLCTLRGPGTEWLSNRSVHRSKLGHGDNRKIVKSGAIVYEVAPFQICILKGDSFPGNKGGGVVHRSPMVSQESEGRYFLRIDAAS